MRHPHWLALSLVAPCLIATSSCSSEEFQPSASGGKSGDAGVGGTGGGKGGTGGSGGTGAVGGTAGSGGLPADCKNDPDCDDGKACTGKETCSAGKCVAGTPVDCPNPDAAHCDGVCAEAAGGTSTCLVKGKDADGDTHLDKACTGSSLAADDCDDSNKKVHPGATESCDGIDNDCNGKDEIEEGTSMSGSTADFLKGTSNTTNPHLAWSPVSKHYGLVWRDDAVGIRYVRMSPVGAPVGTPTAVTATGAVPHIAWSGTQFGVTWLDGGKIYFRRVAADGTFPEAAKVISDAAAKPVSDPAIAPTPNGFAVIWTDYRVSNWGALYARAVASNGTPDAADTPVGTPSGSSTFPSIAGNGSSLFVAHERGATSPPSLIQVFGLSPTLATSGEKTISADPPPTGWKPERPVVTATSTGWAVAWLEASASVHTMRYYEQLASGAAGCTPVSLPAKPLSFPGDVRARGGARLFAWADDQGLASKFQLTRFKAGCASPKTVKLSEADSPVLSGTGIALEWSDQSAVVMWVDQSSGVFTLRRWVSGPNLCDAPVP
ncbi:MAG: putative metal-binding motif-containing protein [Myxococcales bacterium]|nr:putative metal-binding motif-containing protein [Myxococcales bacterium]